MVLVFLGQAYFSPLWQQGYHPCPSRSQKCPRVGGQWDGQQSALREEPVGGPVGLLHNDFVEWRGSGIPGPGRNVPVPGSSVDSAVQHTLLSAYCVLGTGAGAEDEIDKTSGKCQVK